MLIEASPQTVESTQVPAQSKPSAAPSPPHSPHSSSEESPKHTPAQS